MIDTEATPLEVLREARALLADPAHWTQGAFARRANGGGCYEGDKRSVCWCPRGAISYVILRAVDFGDRSIHQLQTDEAAAKALADAIYRADSSYESDSKDAIILRYNDTAGRIHAEVLDRFDEAIESLEVRDAESTP